MMNNSNVVDILEFNLLVSKDDPDDIIYNNIFNMYKFLYFETTINLRLMKYNKNYEEINKKIYNKFIKAKLLKNIINKYNLNKYIKTYNKYILIKYINKLKNLNLNKMMKDKIQKVKDSIFYINFLFDNTDNIKEEKKYALIHIFNYNK